MKFNIVVIGMIEMEHFHINVISTLTVTNRRMIVNTATQDQVNTIQYNISMSHQIQFREDKVLFGQAGE